MKDMDRLGVGQRASGPRVVLGDDVCGGALWSPAAVDVRLVEAFDNLKRCGFRAGDRPGQPRVAWPEVARDLGLIDQIDLETEVRLAPPSMSAYDRMVEALQWLLVFKDDPRQRILMSARASGAKWPRIRRVDGRDEKTLRKYYDIGLARIAARLNSAR
jgi:hypothetical protein